MSVEATATLALLALPLVPGALDAAVRAGQVPSLAERIEKRCLEGDD